MATQLEASTNTARRLGIGCIVITIVILVFNAFRAVLFPTQTVDINPWPTIAVEEYGELPTLSFDSLEILNKENTDYRIETIDGKLPDLNPSPVVYVYKTQVPRQSLTAQDDAVRIAKELGFTKTPQSISSTELKWEKNAQSLNIDKLYQTVVLETDYANNAAAKKNYTILADEQVYINGAKARLQSTKLYPDDFETAKTIVTYLRLDQNFNLRTAKSASEANFVRVDFIPEIERLTLQLTEEVRATLTEEQITELEANNQISHVLSDKPDEGHVYVILGGREGKEIIFEMGYTRWDVEERTTYSLLPIEEAWNQVSSNHGYIRKLLEAGGDQYQPYTPLEVEGFYLTNVTLDYYSPDDYAKTIQPIYVFTGVAELKNSGEQAEFSIYYPAIVQ